MEALNYQIGSLKRRLIFEKQELKEASYFRLEGVEPGMVFLGRVEAYHNRLNGYFVDLSLGRKGLYQSKEKLEIGSRYLFEVRKVQEGKQPLLSRNVGLMGQYVIYRPLEETAASRNLSPEAAKAFLDMGIEHVYFKSEAQSTSFFRVKEEIEELRRTWQDIEHISLTERKARLLYTPKRVFDDTESLDLLEFEEDLVRLRQNVVLENGLRYDIEVTKVGLVIDVNSAGFRGTHAQANDQAVGFLNRLLLRMNVGGLVIMDLIGHGALEHHRNLLKTDPRNRVINISALGLLEIARKREGISMYDLTELEVMAEYINFRKDREDPAREIHGVRLSKRYQGIEEYLDLEVEYAEVFGYYEFY